MHIEILTTGDEVCSGVIVDSNAAHIAARIEEAGIKIERQTCVRDDIKALSGAIKNIAQRADIAIVTGGLGPTVDDMTSQSAAEAAGVELAPDSEALRTMKLFFKKLNRPIRGMNKKQAMLPKGAICLENPIGTAPGFCMTISGCTFFFLPGVPGEMRLMLADKVMPQIAVLRKKTDDHYMVKTISVFGLTESAVNERLADFNVKYPGITLGFRAKFPEIHIKFYLQGDHVKQMTEQMENAGKWVYQRIGDNVFSFEELSMEAEVGRLLRRLKATLATAESCTGGLIAHLLTNVPGSSAYFLCSAVTYANEAKINVLGVSPDTLNRVGAVHEETVKEMALGVRRIANATYGIAVSGIAGPDGGSDEKPVGTICIGLAAPDEVRAYRFHFPFGDRRIKKMIFATKALDILRRKLMVL